MEMRREDRITQWYTRNIELIPLNLDVHDGVVGRKVLLEEDCCRILMVSGTCSPLCVTYLMAIPNLIAVLMEQ